MELARSRISYNSIFKSIIVAILLVLLIFFINADLNINIVAIFLLVLPTLIIFASKEVFTKIVAFIYFCLLFTMVTLNIIEFTFIPQAKVLLDANNSLLYWFSTGNPHAVRLLIAYPGYILSEIFEVDIHLGFTYYGIYLFMVLYLTATNIIRKVYKYKHGVNLKVKYLIVIIPFIILPFIMNGRLIAAFLGYTFLINIFIDFINDNKKMSLGCILGIFISLILTMVSSGVMTVAIAYLLLMTYAINHRKINKKRFLKRSSIFLLFFSPIIYKIFDYLILMLNKNIVFFGGGIRGFINMLNHGVGRIFFTSDWIFYTSVITGVLILLINASIVVHKVKRIDNRFALFLAVNIATYGLLFGFSTGLMMVPPLIILLLVRV